MTDKELLTMAAKAAGIEIEWNVMINLISPILAPKTQQERNWLSHEHTPWNPLTDDGDALRLAVKLGVELLFTKNRVGAGRHSPTAAPWTAEDRNVDDPYAATRRAIVRAAAEIGRNTS